MSIESAAFEKKVDMIIEKCGTLRPDPSEVGQGVRLRMTVTRFSGIKKPLQKVTV